MSSLPVSWISAALGFCGVIYELVFAQSLSVLFGQSVIQYSVTIGLFLAGMGCGSHFSERLADARRGLWLSQLLLCLLTPLMFWCTWWLGISGLSIPAKVMGYGMCFVIGAVTGAELPLLMRMSGSSARVLAWDYVGMLLACLAFPLVLLPHIGVFAALLWCALLNGLLMMLIRWERAPSMFWAPGLIVLGLFLEPGLREWLSQQLTAG